MRHLKAGRRLGRTTAHRKALFRNLVTSLLKHGRIRTTTAKAKELRSVVEKVITLSKRVPVADLETLTGDALVQAKARRVHAIRQARLLVEDREVLQTLFTEYAARYAARPGGYTRIFKVGRRPGDQAEMSLIELVTEAYPPVADAAPVDSTESAGA